MGTSVVLRETENSTHAKFGGGEGGMGQIRCTVHVFQAYCKSGKCLTNFGGAISSGSEKIIMLDSLQIMGLYGLNCIFNKEWRVVAIIQRVCLFL